MNKQILIRKSHRYLGLFIGIQFIAWTISGLYFSWNKIDNVHGDHLRKKISYLPANVAVVSPSIVIDKLKAKQTVDSIHSVHLIRILDKPAYQIAYFSGHSGEGMHLHTHYALADALTGELRGPLNKEEATQIASEQLVNGAQPSKVEYLQQTNGHHEYREKPLPAWAVTYTNPECTVYVSAELGTFQSIRHNQWRAFDFLWMLHTMDYKERDNLNNILLRTFSIFGLITVLSGFLLYFVSSRTLKKITA
jgi:uncharacterized iron-regulated membrane protein